MSDDETIEDLLEVDDIDDGLFETDDEAADDEDIFDDDEAIEDGGEDTAEEQDGETPVPLDASEDGDDELTGDPPVDLAAIEGLEVDDPVELAREDDEDPDDTIKDGEFVCSSCHMAKRSSALADPDEMLCRDCV